MNKGLLTLLELALLIVCAAGHANGVSTTVPAGLQAYTAVYELQKKGITIAEATFSLHQTENGHGWTFQSHAEPRGLAAILTSQTVSEQSRFSLRPDGVIQPLYYSIEHSDAERAAENNLQVRYDWQAGKAAVDYRQKTTRIDLDTALFDPLSEQVALMLDLHASPDQLIYRVIDNGQAERHRYTVGREETVETPNGAHPSIRLVRNHGKRKTIMWFARNLNYLPVKIRQYRNDELKSELVLSRVRLE